MSALIRFKNRALLQNIINQTIRNARQIKTSQKNRETYVASPQAKTETTTQSKDWVSYGFDRKNQAEDINTTKASYFFSVTLCLVWGTFIWSYLPDPKLRDWAQREGYLELRRREKAGLDLVSPNYIDPSTMVLPSDEDLGDTKIII